jgi:O-antigen ligase
MFETRLHSRTDVSQSARSRFVRCLTQACLLFATVLAFLVPFDPSRNIDMQGIVLIFCGGAGWLAVLARRPHGLAAHGRLVLVLGTTYVLCIIASLALSPHFAYGLLGAPYLRLGAAGLLACLGGGLCLEDMESEQLIQGLYYLICVFAVMSTVYTWLHFHSLTRIGGLFSQADTFAIIIGCGFLLGVHLYANSPKNRPLLGILQTMLGVLLICSETRAVIGLIVIMLGAWLLHERVRWPVKRLLAVAAISIVIIGGLAAIAPKRITNVAYGTESTRYRLELQTFGLSQVLKEPIWGYGPGNLADALSCSLIKARMLTQTCQQGYFFNSTHNIFLDRILMIGWVGGLAFACLVVIILYRAYRYSNAPTVLVLCPLLISLYYLTNVTNIEVELLLCVLLCHLSFANSRRLSSQLGR